MTPIDSTKLTMVKPDGKVGLFPYMMKAELLKKGFALITNPKQNYYVQFDRTLKGYGQNPEEVKDDDPSYLEVEKL